MGDSPDIFGNDASEGEEPQPSAAELEAAGQSSMFGAPDDPVPTPNPEAPASEAPASEAPVAEAPAATPVATPVTSAQPYRVLARKYRPQTFAELIGQEAMVRTLANAIERGRLAHAFLMTGVRGVGKTSTARLIAKALNCVGADGQGGPTISPCGQCEPCRAIAEGRHIDVIEMDAASHTSVDDVREIIEAVRYASVSARYKIYIIDEVHMLSRNAFNALLKTLEEPPAHVKFLFATTEADKLPVTVLSRCQRFDLRRIPTALLQEHFAGICAKEGVEAEDEALAMVAAAAEGSVRDGLSILDQAIAHADLDAGGKVMAERVADMLGLADKSARRALFAAIMAGDAQALLDGVARQYALGVEPLAIMRALMEITHRITVAQISGDQGDHASAEEREAIAGWAGGLAAGQLHRLWQLLLKGHDEVRNAPDPMVAAQMALLRVMHAADMPDPGTLARKIDSMVESGVALSATASSEAGGPAISAASVAAPGWVQLVDIVDRAGLLRIAQIMHDWLRVVSLEQGRLVYALAPGLSADPASEIRDALFQATGQRWEVLRGEGEGAPSLREQAETQKVEAAAALRQAPLVEAVFAAFPDAELIEEEQAPRNARQWGR